jgi:hypothetical protein
MRTFGQPTLCSETSLETKKAASVAAIEPL